MSEPLDAGLHARGEELFTMKCKGCHGVDRRVIGPPLQEIATLYREDPEAIVRWAHHIGGLSDISVPAS